MRVTTLKAAGRRSARLIDYYAGLAEDRQRRDGLARGPVDYYLDPDEPPGRWWGRAAMPSASTGEVEPDQLRADARGPPPAIRPAARPAVRRRLGSGVRRDVLGAEVGVGAVGAVARSVGAGRGPRRPRRRRDAALGWFERHGAVTRRGNDGVDQVDTRGLVVALFRQHTSRTVDPQLHTHAMIWSKVQDPTGTWLALDARFLKYQQRTIGWVYDAALRAELTARLGVAWEPIGRAARPTSSASRSRCGSCSRSAARRSRPSSPSCIRRWADEHDGAEPDPRTIARLERDAVTAQPARQGSTASAGRRPARPSGPSGPTPPGFDPLTLPGHEPPCQASPTGWDRRGGRRPRRSDGSRRSHRRGCRPTWPATSPPSSRPTPPTRGADLVELVDELAAIAADAAASSCTRRAARRRTARRTGGRSASTSPTGGSPPQPSSTRSAGCLRWARSAARPPPFRSGTSTPQASIRRRPRRRRRRDDADWCWWSGPPGRQDHDARRRPSTALRLAAAARCSASRRRARPPTCSPAKPAARPITLAKLLADHRRPDRLRASRARRSSSTRPAWPPPTTSTGSSASSDAHRWRLVCVGDPDQLPAVGRGGMFAHWCDTLPTTTSTRSAGSPSPGRPTPASAFAPATRVRVDAYAAHGRLHATHPALVAERVARATLEPRRRRATPWPSPPRPPTTARAINRRHPAPRAQPATRTRRSRSPTAPGSVPATGSPPAATTRTSSRPTGAAVRNRHTWTVTAVAHATAASPSTTPSEGRLDLPADYVARARRARLGRHRLRQPGRHRRPRHLRRRAHHEPSHVYVAMTRGGDTQRRLGPRPHRDTGPSRGAGLHHSTAGQGTHRPRGARPAVRPPAAGPSRRDPASPGPARSARARPTRSREGPRAYVRFAVNRGLVERTAVQGGQRHAARHDASPAHEPCRGSRTPRCQPTPRPSPGRRATHPVPEVGPSAALRPR